MSAHRYVVFLRGINVGGNALVKMTEAKQAFESLGFTHVVSVLASGNLVFEATESKPNVLTRQIEDMLARKFGLQATAILRTSWQLSQVTKLNPFCGQELSPQTKLQVTFLDEETKTKSQFPVTLPTSEFKVIQISPSEIWSAVDLSTSARTPELMNFLEKQFGKGLTTRTLSTVEKIAKILGPVDMSAKDYK